MPSDSVASHFEQHARVFQASLEALRHSAAAVAAVLRDRLEHDGKVIAFGNGGSAAQASHFVGELIGKFRQTRRPLPALALTPDPAVGTCIGNDFGFEAVFERQVEALAQADDVVFGLTTSGQSANVLRGLAAAQERGAITVAMTGANGLHDLETDHLLAVPSTDAALVQEMHLVLFHAWCAHLDAALLSTTDAHA